MRQLNLLLVLLIGCSTRPVILDERPEGPELVGVWYTVASGDTVAVIAARYDVPEEDIVELNGLVDPDQLEVGQALFLFGIEELIRRKAPPEPSKPASKIPALIWPTKTGAFTSGFGPRWGKMHKGIDIAAKVGTPILAAADGTVIYSDDKQRGYGNLVLIRHTGGVVTVYAHNQRNLVDEGDEVRQGAQVAELGNTGRSTGPHLHFEIRVQGEAVDPLIYLPAR